jgi:hypothetical protein
MAKDRDDDRDDRPRRRDDDYDDRPKTDLTGLDKFFSNIAVGIVLAVVGLLCCPLISIILGGIGMATCKNPDSKKHAMFAVIGGVAGIILNVVLYATGAFKFNLGAAN